MPRYFFDVSDHGKETDDVGQELSGPDHARSEAVMFVGGLLRDDPDLVWDGRELRVTVNDEAGAEILSVFVHAVDVPPATTS